MGFKKNGTEKPCLIIIFFFFYGNLQDFFVILFRLLVHHRSKFPKKENISTRIKPSIIP